VTATPEDAVDRAEAVVVATPAGTHASLTREILERDLPVLVEKPFALSVREAEALAELAERRGVPVLVGHLLLFHPAVERLKAMVGGGDLGDVYYLYSQRVNLGQVRPDENALWSFGPHDVSVALFLLDKAPTRVAAQGRSYLQPGIEDVVLDPHKERRLTVVGSRRMVVFDDMQPREKLKVYDKGVERPPEYTSYGESLAVREGDIAIPWIPSIEPLSAELRHFVDVARGATVPRSSAEDGVRVVRVLEAASRSLSSGGAAVTFARGHAA
jgi:predicted dehydrogenase